jgi:hypothetical protein
MVFLAKEKIFVNEISTFCGVSDQFESITIMTIKTGRYKRAFDSSRTVLGAWSFSF